MSIEIEKAEIQNLFEIKINRWRNGIIHKVINKQAATTKTKSRILISIFSVLNFSKE